MLQIVDYQQNATTIMVGFKKHNFVVYGQIGIIEGYTKEQHLQKLYEQCKLAIDYETERYIQGKPNSIVTDLEGEEFIPELPKLKTLKLLVDKSYIQFEEGQEHVIVQLSTLAKDQYGEDIDTNISITSNYGYSTDGNKTLTIPKVDEYMEILLTVYAEDLRDSNTICVYPYVEPIPPQSTPEELKIQELEQQLLEVQQYIINKEAEELLKQGGI